jgi:hypothetical protein
MCILGTPGKMSTIERCAGILVVERLQWIRIIRHPRVVLQREVPSNAKVKWSGGIATVNEDILEVRKMFIMLMAETKNIMMYGLKVPFCIYSKLISR